MTESITREEAEERLSGAINIEFTLNMLFPPKPTFKKGEVIAVRDHISSIWIFRMFVKMTKHGRYHCKVEGSLSSKISWKFARAQTDEERGK